VLGTASFATFGYVFLSDDRAHRRATKAASASRDVNEA
jgi:hypothetical protein